MRQAIVANLYDEFLYDIKKKVYKIILFLNFNIITLNIITQKLN